MSNYNSVPTIKTKPEIAESKDYFQNYNDCARRTRSKEIGEKTNNSIDKKTCNKFDFSTSAPSRADKVMEVIKNLAGSNQRTRFPSDNKGAIVYRRIRHENGVSTKAVHKVIEPDWWDVSSSLEFEPFQLSLIAQRSIKANAKLIVILLVACSAERAI